MCPPLKNTSVNKANMEFTNTSTNNTTAVLEAEDLWLRYFSSNNLYLVN